LFFLFVGAVSGASNVRKKPQRAAAEERGVQARCAALGKRGLAACKRRLETAISMNAPKPLPVRADGSLLLTPPPASSIPTLPMAVSLRKIPRSLALGGAAAAAAPAAGVSLAKTAVQVVRTDTAFHSVSIGFDCRRVAPHLRPWLVLLQEVMMSSDILEVDGSITPYTDAIKMRQQQTVSMWTSTGWGGGAFSASVMPELFFIRGQALPSAQGFGFLCDWIGKILGRSMLGPARVAVCAKNLNKDITSSLRDGDAVCSAILNRITLHQLLAAEGAPGLKAEASQTATSRKGSRRGSKQSELPAVALDPQISEQLVGARNEAAINLLAQRPLLRKLVNRIKAEQGTTAAERAEPPSEDNHKRSGQAENVECAAIQEAVAALSALRQSILLDFATGTSNALFIQISAPHRVEEGKDDDALVGELHAKLASALQHLASSSPAQTQPVETRKRVRTSKGKASAGAADDSTVSAATCAEGASSGGKAGSSGLDMVVNDTGVQRRQTEEQAVVVAVKGCDSSYLEMAVPCGVHKNSAEYAAVHLLCELLSRSEGPMWERIRGRGLAYHASLELWPWQGQIGFSLGECADPAAAWREMEAILKECRLQLSATDMKEITALDAALMEARCSALFGLHSKRSTPGAAASTAAKGHWWGMTEIEGEADREAAALEAVDKNALLEVFHRYFATLLAPGERCTCVVVPAGKEVSIAAELESALGLERGSVHMPTLAQLMIPSEA
jgi:Zn-dependent M16 (insulinase) family peptidase